MTPLAHVIRQHIEGTGPMSVADYMGLCLGHPEYGYYITRDPFGKSGDFITAPEISQMFGELIGLWFAQAWIDRGSPKECHLIECGPGRGTLMSDILRATKMAPGFQDSLRIHLIETSPALRQVQKQTLDEYSVEWHENLNTLPDPTTDSPQFFVANEFFDALPIQQLLKTDVGWRERVIVWDDESKGFAWSLNARKTNLDAMLSEMVIKEAETGSIAEVSPISITLAEIMADHIARSNGVGLFIDYGYAQSATGDSFQALKDHEFCDCLDHCGEADLTAHVDFQAIANAFNRIGCESLPLLEQGLFLQRMGIEARAAQLAANGNEKQKQDIASALKRLTDNEEMGSLFKVLAIRAADGPSLAGFEAG
ncbi:class I SAM-dependent methyltransferase [Curvivirga sp.]|uniref:class I SAM-dependent methyltransferase n=1 Tax=Curvivirga sp. TaxID=2856848 RepID=UPI003B594D5B